MKVIITGATGMVGNIVLKKCIDSEEIDEIIVFIRKLTGIKHPKLKEIVLSDFMNYSLHQKEFEEVGAVYFCIGVYTGQVPDDKFKEITVDYTIAFANVLKEYSPGARFCFLSGSGADQTEKSRVSFAKYKGMAENYLLKNLTDVYLFRPGYIFPVEKRKEPNFSYRIFRALYPIVSLFGKNASIKSTELAEVMFATGLKGGSKRVLENRDILNLLDEAVSHTA